MWDKSPVHTFSIFLSRTGQAGLGFNQGTRNTGKERSRAQIPHPSSGRCPGSAVPPAMCSLDMGMLSPLCHVCVFWAALSVGQCPPFGVMLLPPCSVWDRGSGDGSLLVQRSCLPPGSPAVPGTRTPEPCRGTGRLAAQCGRHGASLASSSQQNG